MSLLFENGDRCVIPGVDVGVGTPDDVGPVSRRADAIPEAILPHDGGPAIDGTLRPPPSPQLHQSDFRHPLVGVLPEICAVTRPVRPEATRGGLQARLAVFGHEAVCARGDPGGKNPVQQRALGTSKSPTSNP